MFSETSLGYRPSLMERFQSNKTYMVTVKLITYIMYVVNVGDTKFLSVLHLKNLICILKVLKSDMRQMTTLILTTIWTTMS